MQNGDTLIEVKDLHKSFGKHEVLKGMNMTVKKGEVIAIIGPSVRLWKIHISSFVESVRRANERCGDI